MKKQKRCLLVVLCCILIFSTVAVCQASLIGNVLKGGAIGLLVDKFSGPLNSFVNTITFQKGGKHNSATKVVPVLSIGDGSYAGAAQVIGQKSLVDKTNAVLQVEGNFKDNFRVKALIPVDSKSITKFNRVEGVGVSAMIDVRL